MKINNSYPENGFMAGREYEVPHEDILAVLAESSDPVLGTNEVADHLPIGNKGTYQRLMELTNMGYVKTKKVPRDRVWWITDSGRAYVENG